MDQHDKWRRFGLFLHGCVDGFTRKILWLVIWWNNSNPRFVCAQYLKTVRHIGGMFQMFLSFIMDLLNMLLGAPCVTQSDRGTENYNIAYAHTHIRHALDPTLSGSIQHQWKHGHSNVKPEQMWWRLRRTWAPGYEKLLEEGARQQWFDCVNVADRCVCPCHINERLEVHSIETGLSSAGWPSLGSRRRWIRMSVSITHRADEQIDTRYYPMVFQMPCSIAQKPSMRSTSRYVDVSIQSRIFTSTSCRLLFQTI